MRRGLFRGEWYMIKKIMNWKWVRNGKEFADGIKQEHVSAYAGASAFFIFLSVFPLLNILLMLTPFLPYSEQELVDFLVQIFPEDFSSFVRGIQIWALHVRQRIRKSIPARRISNSLLPQGCGFFSSTTSPIFSSINSSSLRRTKVLS